VARTRALSEYRRKRDFNETREPSGVTPRARRGRTFVVQHHRASHDHDDFRLELDGVLKSWAVPKRVSTRAGEKRLAVQVEDHPLEYGKFKGTIPEGQYGAGRVWIWDAGRWETEDDARAALASGKLRFRLFGRKMKGQWALVRMGSRSRRSGARPQWLLMKLGTTDSTSALRRPGGTGPAKARR
jgi:bifunctional non-homologous end joining protein LigD